MKTLLTLILLLTVTTTLALAGGPVRPSSVQSCTPPPIHWQPYQVTPFLQPQPALPPAQPVMSPVESYLTSWSTFKPEVFGGATIYMTDYTTKLSLTGIGELNFGDAFGWSSKSAIYEYNIGFKIPRLFKAEFTYMPPITRMGNGIPAIPLALGGYTFGPRPVDTIRLSTSLSGERLVVAAPVFNDYVMLTGLCEWWKLGIEVNGTPTTTTTSQPAVNVKQDFQKFFTGIGVSGELPQRPLQLSYKAIYLVGGQTTGWFLEGAVGITNKRLSVIGGYRLSTRSVGFGGGHFNTDTNGYFGNLTLTF